MKNRILSYIERMCKQVVERERWGGLGFSHVDVSEALKAAGLTGEVCDVMTYAVEGLVVAVVRKSDEKKK